MSHSLAELLQQQQQQLAAMLELLLVERDCMIRRDSEQLNEINQRKVEQLQAIQQLDHTLAQQYSASDFAATEIQTLKQQLEQQLQQLQQQNQVNGKIIAHSQVNLNMLKDLMLGGISSKKDKSAMTYDQAGKKSSALKGRPIKA